MKRKATLLSFLFLMALTVFTACKDDEDPRTPEQDATEQLTAGPYTVNTVTLSPAADYVFDGNTTITFNANNTFTITNPGELPNPAATPTSPLPASGTWAFTTAGTFNNITLTSGNVSVPLAIITRTDSELVFEYEGVEPKENNVTVRVNATRN